MRNHEKPLTVTDSGEARFVREEIRFIRIRRTWHQKSRDRENAFSEPRGGDINGKGRESPAENTALPFVRSGCSRAEPDWSSSIFPVRTA